MADAGHMLQLQLLRNTIASQAAELANCKTVMIAAAEEIAAHWDAHCDAEGYGPQNLQRRLEEGIPAEYGYTAGAFATLRAERDAAVALLDEVRSHFTRDDDLPDGLLDRIDASLRTEQEQQL